MLYNFNEVVYKNLEDKDLTPEEKKRVLQVLGNEINIYSKDIGLSDVARAIYNGNEVEIDSNQMEKIKLLIDGDVQTSQNSYVPRFSLIVKEGLMDYINSKSKKVNKK